MSADISSVPPLPLMQDGGDRRRAHTAQEDERRAPRARAGAALIPPPGQAGDGRLMIEEDKATGDFVYRIVDQKTGEVLRQWPREEVLRMRRTENVARGSILDQKV